MTPFARGAAPDWLHVSPRALGKLESLLVLVEKWNPAINLVAPGSLSDAWHRHVLDSAQLIQFIPPQARRVADFGSGAGFPGLVLAILAQDVLPDLRITLVEADKRKATFLAQAGWHLGVEVDVLTDRAEILAPQGVDVITARALAPLTSLCGLASRHIAPGGVAVFPKGAQAEKELAEAAAEWTFDVLQHQSHTDEAARILTLKSICHV